MNTQRQTELRLAATDMVLRVNELSGMSNDVYDTEDLIEKANHLYIFLTTGQDVYELENNKPKEKEGE